ncbi:hypothetical protein AGDE_05211 [Angomonas deanei]|nr:hypothetical protein AGDE_05211 [Angomonas deanei]|eukprot:EPY38718.1 hypothetical protein AGDE_05211 [Angomonas deanei]
MEQSTVPPGFGVGNTLWEELNVGPPTFGVLVCYLQCLLFFCMSAYLLGRHWNYARRNVTTIDCVIFEHTRKLQEAQRNLSGEDSFSNDREAPTDEAAFKDYLDENVYDLGVRRNLLQVFGDAKLHGRAADRDEAESEGSGHFYFQDLMEGDQYRFKNPVIRWFTRLLPIQAYRPQKKWPLYDSAHMATSYGSVDGGGSLLDRLGVTEEMLLGLRFPTRDSLAL